MMTTTREEEVEEEMQAAAAAPLLGGDQEEAKTSKKKTKALKLFLLKLMAACMVITSMALISNMNLNPQRNSLLMMLIRSLLRELGQEGVQLFNLPEEGDTLQSLQPKIDL